MDDEDLQWRCKLLFRTWDDKLTTHEISISKLLEILPLRNNFPAAENWTQDVRTKPEHREYSDPNHTSNAFIYVVEFLQYVIVNVYVYIFL